MINMGREELKELKITQAIINSENYNFSSDQNSLIISFGNYIMHSFDSGVLEKLFDDDIHIASLFFESIAEFCIVEKLSIFGVLESMIKMDFELFNYTIVKILKDKDLSSTKLIVGNFYDINSVLDVSIENKINITVQSSPSITLETLSIQAKKRINELQDYATQSNMGNNPKFYQSVLDNSYDEIEKRVIDNIDNMQFIISRVDLNSSVAVEEIKETKEVFSDTFTNTGTMGNIKKGNHFLDYLKKDELEITEDYKIVFKGHTNAFSIGYTDKAILCSVDKNKTLRDLNDKLDALNTLKYLDNQPQSYDDKIKLTKHCIEFIQNTNQRFIPFKILSDKMGISEYRIKAYAKAVFDVKNIRIPQGFHKFKSYPHNNWFSLNTYPYNFSLFCVERIDTIYVTIPYQLIEFLLEQIAI